MYVYDHIQQIFITFILGKLKNMSENTKSCQGFYVQGVSKLAQVNVHTLLERNEENSGAVRLQSIVVT